jgi:hypothetical protein
MHPPSKIKVRQCRQNDDDDIVAMPVVHIWQVSTSITCPVWCTKGTFFMYYDKWFQKDPHFAHIAFNHEQMKEITTAGYLTAERKVFHDITVYRHHFSHHFDFFILVQPQREFCKTSYVGCLYSMFRCLNWIFRNFLHCIHCFWEHTRMWPDWHPKLSFFTPVGTELKSTRSVCACPQVTRKVSVGQYKISISNTIQYTTYNHAWWGIGWPL